MSKTQDYSRADLSHHDFKGQNLYGVIFRYAKLREANLQDVSCEPEVQIEKLEGFTRAALIFILEIIVGFLLELFHITNGGVLLSFGNNENKLTNFFGADLTDANLKHANLRKAYFRKAILKHANLANASLTHVNLIKADLSSAILKNADLNDAILSNANLEGADLSDADLMGANLTAAILKDTNLSGANLGDANLCEANLEGADLSGSCLDGANFKNTNLCHAVLHGVDLRVVKNLKKAYLMGVDLGDAILPEIELPFNLPQTKL
jgi:uncharacterized protein YjbI with pentapeptide repeats